MSISFYIVADKPENEREREVAIEKAGLLPTHTSKNLDLYYNKLEIG